MKKTMPAPKAPVKPGKLSASSAAKIRAQVSAMTKGCK
jgi:hypothetical protein